MSCSHRGPVRFVCAVAVACCVALPLPGVAEPGEDGASLAGAAEPGKESAPLPGAAEPGKDSAPLAGAAEPAGESPASADGAAPGRDEAPLSPAAARYRDAVRAREDEGGAYSAELAQELFGLGLAYQQDGRHQEAVQALTRAEHVTRVNEGLFSTSDLPILERLIESHAALGNWEQVESRYRQVFNIHRRNYGEQDARMLPTLQRLSSWHLRAYVDDMGGEPLNHLLTARNLYDSSARIIEANYGATDTRMADTLRQRALVDYYVASYVPTADEGFSFGDDTIQATQVQSYLANSFVSGRDALRRVVELRRQDGNSSELARSQALAELADWHQLFTRRQTALGLYQEAWAEGAQAGEAAPRVLQTVFGQPRALPVLPAELDEVVPPREDPAYIAIRFAVNETGRAEGMEVVESAPPATDKHISRLRKRLSATVFRPRFENGQPVATANVDYRYTYTP